MGSPSPDPAPARRRPRLRIRLPRGGAWRAWTVATAVCWLLAVVAGAGAASLLQRQLPQIQSLEDYDPLVLTRIYDRRGGLLQQLGEQRRLVVPLDQISPWFRQAIVAIEDSDFFIHPGVDLSAIARAVVRDLQAGRIEQGASTITQQLATDLFLLKEEKTLTRKLQELILALQIEKTYTKEEILALYANQIYFGHGFYGIEAASRFYYGKPASALTLDEAALLAGLVQRPNAYSPFRAPERARRRRDFVLTRMQAEGFLTSAQADAAAARPVAPRAEGAAGRRYGLYFLEEVRKELVDGFGDTALYQDGLEVATTLDPTLQRLAEAALRRALRQVDRQRGFRPVGENVIDDHGSEPEEWTDPAWETPLPDGEAQTGVVLEVSRDRALVRLGPEQQGVLQPEGAAWTGQSDLRKLLRRGDRTLFTAAAGDGGEVPLTLDQEPQVEGAVVVLDPASGEVLALVGGYDFGRSQFDRAVQARRQVGSAFKPMLYAAALESGLTPADQVFDDPTVFVDPQTGDLYQPENYERDYEGLMTLRYALEHSRNIPAVKLINHIGFKPVFDVARRLGISTPLQPYASLALGAVEVSLLEMTAAYGAFANGGLRLQPFLVKQVDDRSGGTRRQSTPTASEALDPAVAYVLTQMLQGVVRRGTAASIADFPGPVAGKTGTTDGHSDAWFIGYTPDLVCGVWVGLDQSDSLGRGQSGARVALPIWNEIMRAAVAGRPPAEFSRPPGAVQAPVDFYTGARASMGTGCREIVLESFLEGSEPRQSCDRVAHYRQELPYFLQMLPLDEELRLALSRDELDALRDREARFVEWLPLSQSLTVTYGDRTTSVAVRLKNEGLFRSWRLGSDADDESHRASGPMLGIEMETLPEGLPEPPEDVLPLEERRGLDGRRPFVVVIRPER